MCALVWEGEMGTVMGGDSRCTTEMETPTGRAGAGNSLGEIPEDVCDPVWGSVRMGGCVLGWE